MEADESVPLTFEKQGAEVTEVIPGMQVRGAADAVPAEVIDITGLIGELEASRRGSGG